MSTRIYWQTGDWGCVTEITKQCKYQFQGVYPYKPYMVSMVQRDYDDKYILFFDSVKGVVHADDVEWVPKETIKLWKMLYE